MKRKKIEITESSRNIFSDLGFPPTEAQNLIIRAQLMLRLRDIIQRRKLTQSKAAKLFGVTQPRVSDLVRGKIERFSVDVLIEMLHRAGMDVDVTVRPKAA